ncbi:hypothetical protein [Umezawaea sp.]|uniref:hypothetical protein n=1 Tax=Umezawaea sp. TaxID=1955258 RepID=UPI002ED5238B
MEGDSSHTTARRDERSVRGGFADVLSAEPAWVREEFAAIVSANFGAPAPRRRPRPSPPRGRRPAEPPAPAGSDDHDDLIGERERSPPPV